MVYAGASPVRFGCDDPASTYDYSEQQLEDVKDSILVRDIVRGGRRDEKEVRAEIAQRRAQEHARAEEKAKAKAEAEVNPPGLGMRTLIWTLKPLFLLLVWIATLLLRLFKSPTPTAPPRNEERIEQLRGDFADLKRIDARLLRKLEEPEEDEEERGLRSITPIESRTG